MASPPPASSSLDSSLETSILSEIGDLAPDDIFICARPKHRNRRLLQVVKTCYTGSEQDIAKDGKQDISPCPDKRSKHSHECIMDPPRPRTSVFILDSRATSHVVGDVSLFSPSFRSRTTPTTPAGNTAAAYQAHDGWVLTVAGVGTVSRQLPYHQRPVCPSLPDLCTGPNLVSVQQLAECGYLVTFGGGQCSVMEQSSGKIVGKGRLHADDALYHLEFLSIPHDKACEDSTPT